MSPVTARAATLVDSLVYAWSLGLLGLSGCAHPGQTGTPMSSTCREVPTVEECRAVARGITDECLAGCVRLQCAGIQVNCDEYARESCKRDREAGLETLGYVKMTGKTSCTTRLSEVNWCEDATVSRECRARGMVHELAHSCGWDHGQGHGVPGDDGKLVCD
jgi:hypothetical protein